MSSVGEGLSNLSPTKKAAMMEMQKTAAMSRDELLEAVVRLREEVQSKEAFLEKKDEKMAEVEKAHEGFCF